MDLASTVSDELSPYSATYTIELLSNGLKMKLARAEHIAETVEKHLRWLPRYVRLLEKKTRDFRLDGWDLIYFSFMLPQTVLSASSRPLGEMILMLTPIAPVSGYTLLLAILSSRPPMELRSSFLLVSDVLTQLDTLDKCSLT